MLVLAVPVAITRVTRIGRTVPTGTALKSTLVSPPAMFTEHPVAESLFWWCAALVGFTYLGVTQTKETADVVADTFDTLVKAKAWPQNEGLLKANIEGTIASEKGFGKITKDLKFEDVTELTIAKKVVEQLGRVKDFPY